MKKDVKIQGMTCQSCAMRIENSVKKIDGIKDVSVNLLANKATIEYETEESFRSVIAQELGKKAQAKSAPSSTPSPALRPRAPICAPAAGCCWSTATRKLPPCERC